MSPRRSFDAHFSEQDPVNVYRAEKKRAERRQRERAAKRVQEKVCSKCFHTRPLTDFSNNGATLDGKASWCCYCNAEYMRNLRSARRQAGMT